MHHPKDCGCRLCVFDRKTKNAKALVTKINAQLDAVDITIQPLVISSVLAAAIEGDGNLVLDLLNKLSPSGANKIACALILLNRAMKVRKTPDVGEAA